jgi:hypothetical protein
MEPLIINATDSTPSIVLDKTKGIFEITGNSLPENVLAFYEPAISWIKSYINEPNDNTTLVFKLTYLNTASSKTIFSLMALLEQLIDKGKPVQIDWWYMEIDEDTLEAGKEYEGMLKIPFKFFNYA